MIDRYEALQHQQAWRETARRFYADVLPTLVGQEFCEPRSYGHARYRIVGDHAQWRHVRDAQKVYFHYDETGLPVLDGNTIVPHTLCLAVLRLGGYNGREVGTRLVDLLRAVSPIRETP